MDNSVLPLNAIFYQEDTAIALHVRVRLQTLLIKSITIFILDKSQSGPRPKKSEKVYNRTAKYLLYYSANLESEKQMRREGQCSAFFPCLLFISLQVLMIILQNLKKWVFWNWKIFTCMCEDYSVSVFQVILGIISEKIKNKQHENKNKKPSFWSFGSQLRWKTYGCWLWGSTFFRQLQSHSKL